MESCILAFTSKSRILKKIITTSGLFIATSGLIYIKKKGFTAGGFLKMLTAESWTLNTGVCRVLRHEYGWFVSVSDFTIC